MDSVKWLRDEAHIAEGCLAPAEYAVHNGTLPDFIRNLRAAADELAAARAEIERLTDAVLANQVMIQAREAEIERLEAREAHFAKALKVADGGQYREDWCAKIDRLLKLEARVPVVCRACSGSGHGPRIEHPHGHLHEPCPTCHGTGAVWKHPAQKEGK